VVVMSQLYNLFRDQALTFPNKSALVTADQSYSYDDVLCLADRWASHIWNVTKGRPRVALLLDNPLHCLGVSLAVARLDGACIPTHPQWVAHQLNKGWHACEVNVVVFEPAFSQKVENCSSDGIIFISTDVLPSLHPPGGETVVPDSFPWSGEKDYLITLSSGSTGEPKPIVLSQSVKIERAKQTWGLYGLGCEDIVLCASPFFHSLGQRLVFVSLLLGATVVYMQQFTPRQWLALVETNRVTFVIAVSSHLYALKQYLLRNAEQLGSLNTIVTSSAPIDAHFKAQLFEKIGCDFHEIYGTTEVAIATNLAPNDARQKHSSVGLPCDGVDVRIFNDSGEILPCNELGEISVKTPVAFEGYYNQPEQTKNSLRDGYFLTGDLGMIDNVGFLTYVTRKKDVIISGGINIYPDDIEKIISQHAAVRQVAVVGVEDDLLGEVIVATCVIDDSPDIEVELRQLVQQHLAAVQHPLKYFFVDQLPLTPSGKIAKQVLRDHYNGLNDGWTLPLRMMLYGE